MSPRPLFGSLPFLLSACLTAAPPGAPDAVSRTPSPVAAVPAGPPPSSLGAPPPASALPSEGFALLRDEGGVKVYRREQRPGVELAAEGDFAVPPEQVRRVLADYPRHARWQKHLAEQHLLAQGSDFLDVYERITMPILDDRDFTLHVTWGSEGDVLWLRFVAAPTLGPPPVSGVVRVVDHQGGWRLEPKDAGKSTHAVYRFHLDLAGSFPMWMGKGQAASDLQEMFADITRQLPSYR